MIGILCAVKNEWTKLFAMTKYRLLPILLSGFLIATTLISSIPGNILRITMSNFPFTVLSWLGYVLIPIAAFMLTSDLVTNEIETTQIRIVLSRPLSRVKVLLSKVIAIIGYLIMLYLIGFVVSTIICILFTGFTGFSLIATVGAYLLGILPTLALTTMAVSLANCVKNTSSSFALSFCIYLGLLLVSWIFTSVSPILFTSYMGIGSMVAGSTIPVASVLTGVGILIGYTLLFLSVAVIRFEKREF